ncbi:MAG: hypothetical protein OXF27_11030 [Acidobacteria bacterium]|nr:hypothetical protein [Acidobacteriota bacterium]
MLRFIHLGVLLAAGSWLIPGSVDASGSIGTGAGKVSPRAAYSQGKALTFNEIVCDDCPIQKDELDRDRAESLTASLQAVYEGGQAQAGDADAVRALCAGATADDEDCALKMELVHYFLSRRYKL